MSMCKAAFADSALVVSAQGRRLLLDGMLDAEGIAGWRGGVMGQWERAALAASQG